MSFLRDALFDLKMRFEFGWTQLRFKLLWTFKPYRFTKKPMKGEISEIYTYGIMGAVTSFFCTRCGWMLAYGCKRCPICGQLLEWRQ